MRIIKDAAGIKEFYKILDKRKTEGDAAVLKSVEDILYDIKERGNEAAAAYTERFDKVRLSPDNMEVLPEEIDKAYSKIEPALLKVIRKAKENIYDFHFRQKQKSWFDAKQDGTLLGQIVVPLDRVGIYVPGGTAPLPSSVLMNAIPARVAGVREIIMCTPPGKTGEVNDTILVAAGEAGVDRIFKIGGAQAIGALAYGTETIDRVDKITGPGNIYVATAKKLVYGTCDIDMIAGPSEIMIIADGTANPSFIAADLLSQAEHDILSSSILVTASYEIAAMVSDEVGKQLQELSRKEIAEKAINRYSAIIIVKDLNEALERVKEIAPEHLELCIESPFEILGKVRNAGAIFIGNWSPEPLGDYFAGPNHVLPTSGSARFFSPLGVSDFLKRMSVISYPREALEKVKDDVTAFAFAEGLDAHARTIIKRFETE